MWPFDSVPTLDDFRSRIPSWVPGASPPSPSMNPPQGGRRKTYRRKGKKKSKRRRTGRKAIGSLVRLFRM
jgi:hypothetical protein